MKAIKALGVAVIGILWLMLAISSESRIAARIRAIHACEHYTPADDKREGRRQLAWLRSLVRPRTPNPRSPNTR